MLVEGDLAKTHPRAASSVLKALESGARLIVIGCARTQMARLASCFLQTAPGREGDALNGLLAAVIRAERRKAEQAAALCGLDSLRRELTDVNTTEEMRAAAEWLAADRAVFLMGPTGGQADRLRGGRGGNGVAGRNHRTSGQAGQRVAAAVGAEQRRAAHATWEWLRTGCLATSASTIAKPRQRMRAVVGEAGPTGPRTGCARACSNPSAD